MFDYVDGGAEDERTLAANEAAYAAVGLAAPGAERGRARRRELDRAGPARSPSPSCSPRSGFPRLLHPDGELAAARAAARAGLPYTLSTMSSRSIEEVRAVSDGRLWFQVYAWRGPGPGQGDGRPGRARPATRPSSSPSTPRCSGGGSGTCAGASRCRPPLGLGTIVDGALHPGWTWSFVRSEPVRFANVTGSGVADGSTPVVISEFIHEQFDPALSWADVDWLRSIWDGPVLVKGIGRVEDAVRAADAGVDAVVLSNHGGRQLDGAPATFSLVAPVADALGGRTEIICDGGIRRGSDVVKAVAAGATAAMAGRAYLWGLAAAGELRRRPRAGVAARRHGPHHVPAGRHLRRRARPLAARPATDRPVGLRDRHRGKEGGLGWRLRRRRVPADDLSAADPHRSSNHSAADPRYGAIGEPNQVPERGSAAREIAGSRPRRPAAAPHAPVPAIGVGRQPSEPDVDDGARRGG